MPQIAWAVRKREVTNLVVHASKNVQAQPHDYAWRTCPYASRIVQQPA